MISDVIRLQNQLPDVKKEANANHLKLYKCTFIWCYIIIMCINWQCGEWVVLSPWGWAVVLPGSAELASNFLFHREDCVVMFARFSKANGIAWKWLSLRSPTYGSLWGVPQCLCIFYPLVCLGRCGVPFHCSEEMEAHRCWLKSCLAAVCI